MSSREFQPEGTNPVLTGEDVELGSEHFLGDVTSVGEVGKSRRVRRQSVSERQDETSSADDPTAINLDAQNGDENPLENSEAPSDSSSKTDVFEAFMNTPSRTDIAQDVDRPTDVLGNRGAAVFSGTNETMVSLPQSDTGVITRSLAQATQPLPKRTEVPSTSVPSLDEAADQGLLVGATVRPSISSRAGARWLSALSFLLLTPFAWYLLADSGARLFAVDGSPWSTGNYNVAALAEFFGGMAVLLLLGFMATQSSIGLLLSGIVFTSNVLKSSSFTNLGLPTFLFPPGLLSNILLTTLF